MSLTVDSDSEMVIISAYIKIIPNTIHCSRSLNYTKNAHGLGSSQNES